MIASNQKILCPRCYTPHDGDATRCKQCGFDMVLNNAGGSQGQRYRITRVVKAGGQGAVFEAIDEQGKVYAVKQMLDSFGGNDKERAEAVKRFNAEGKLLKQIQHPRIPRVYAVFHDEGYHYIVMDFVRGEDLEDILEREGPIPEARALAWANQIIEVLEYLHDEGMIYRDMKPSNVMIDSADGRIKLIDFGLAKVLQPTQQGTSIGTPGYAPPEQYQGLASRESDVFALGATLHHLLTGRDPTDNPPFNFPPARSLNPAISQRTSDALARALQMRAEDRFPSLESLRDALIPPPQGTQALPQRPQPQQPPPPQQPPAAKPAQPAAKPAQPAPKPAQPAPKPAQPAPVQQSARPAAGGPLAAPQPQVRRSSWRGCFVGLLVALLVGAGALWYLAPELVGGLIGVQQGPTATPQTFVRQPFELNGLVIIVPTSTNNEGVRQAFIAVYRNQAEQQFGTDVQVELDSLTFTDGPEWLTDSPEGAQYRASLRGTVLVPRP
jgi:eukaryotic-like serine/threonine-protein kinase